MSQHLYGLRFYNDNMKNMIQLGPSNQKRTINEKLMWQSFNNNSNII